jgi:hypothetical protein
LPAGQRDARAFLMSGDDWRPGLEWVGAAWMRAFCLIVMSVWM